MSLLTQYPLWLAIFAVLLGVGYALYLYFRNDNVAFEKRDRIIMASLRGLAMSLLAFLLLFADDNTKARLETEAILANPDSKRYSNFDEVVEAIFSDDSDL